MGVRLVLPHRDEGIYEGNIFNDLNAEPGKLIGHQSWLTLVTYSVSLPPPPLSDSHGSPTSRDVDPRTSAPHTGLAVQWWESGGV